MTPHEKNAAEYARVRRLDRHSPEATARKIARAKERYRTDPEFREKTLERNRLSRDPEKSREWNRIRLYGLTNEDYATLRKSQNNRCACCNDALMGGKKEHVDHAHNSGEIRGILCARCNLLIGWRERPEASWAKIDVYLARFK